MATVIKLHPKVKEFENPRLSAAALAEYLIMKPDQQETVLHNARFASPPSIYPHSEALTPITAYCVDPARAKSTLLDAKIRLTSKAEDSSIRPKSREESLRCIETIELFEKSENSFALNSMKLSRGERFAPLAINGVSVSVQPNLIVSRIDANEKAWAGVVMFRPQKAPDPESCRLEETKRQRGEHRREMARYMLAIAKLAMDEHGRHLGEFDRGSSFVADIRMGERIDFSTSDHASRACKQIASLWDDIEPRTSVLAKD
jgi:hypothetical protein